MNTGPNSRMKKRKRPKSLAESCTNCYFTHLETPIKTLDLPVAGRGYSSPTLPLIFETVNLANDVPVVDVTKKSTKLEEPPSPDIDGAFRMTQEAYELYWWGPAPCARRNPAKRSRKTSAGNFDVDRVDAGG